MVVDWKEKINIQLLDFEGWPDWVAGPNGWLRRYAQFVDCMHVVCILRLCRMIIACYMF